ncbi:MAG: hypothetical protein JKY68_00105 [Rhodospirillales bacterium]|nr:hypothetical protein [Rhodospirillales bacterium]
MIGFRIAAADGREELAAADGTLILFSWFSGHTQDYEFPKWISSNMSRTLTVFGRPTMIARIFPKYQRAIKLLP